MGLGKKTNGQYEYIVTYGSQSTPQDHPTLTQLNGLPDTRGIHQYFQTGMQAIKYDRNVIMSTFLGVAPGQTNYYDTIQVKLAEGSATLSSQTTMTEGHDQILEENRLWLDWVGVS